MIRKLSLVFLALSALGMSAQRTNSSPYSFFGVGEEFESRTVEQNTMGGISAAYSSPYMLNLSNPAANADLRLSTYAFGMLSNDLTIKNQTESQSSNSISLSYFALGFPIGKKAGAVFGMQPVSTVGYSLLNSIEDDEGVVEITRFTGNGGTNRIHGGLGVILFDGFSLGIEGSFVFGRVTNNVTNQRRDVLLLTRNEEVTNIRGGILKLGAQYKKELKNKLTIDAGAIFKFSNNFNVTGTESLFSITESGQLVDVLSDEAIRGKLVNPFQTTLGLGIGKKEKWYVGADYSFKNALSPEGYLSGSSLGYSYENESRFSLGGFYTPNVNSIRSYWQRITWRGGLRIEKTGLLVSANQNPGNFTSINDFGISFGFGLPIGKPSSLNVGFELGKRGTTNNSLIQENYFNTRVSLSLSALWFQKRKIN